MKWMISHLNLSSKRSCARAYRFSELQMPGHCKDYLHYMWSLATEWLVSASYLGGLTRRWPLFEVRWDELTWMTFRSIGCLLFIMDSRFLQSKYAIFRIWRFLHMNLESARVRSTRYMIFCVDFASSFKALVTRWKWLLGNGVKMAVFMRKTREGKRDQTSFPEGICRDGSQKVWWFPNLAVVDTLINKTAQNDEMKLAAWLWAIISRVEMGTARLNGSARLAA